MDRSDSNEEEKGDPAPHSSPKILRCGLTRLPIRESYVSTYPRKRFSKRFASFLKNLSVKKRENEYPYIFMGGRLGTKKCPGGLHSRKAVLRDRHRRSYSEATELARVLGGKKRRHPRRRGDLEEKVFRGKATRSLRLQPAWGEGLDLAAYQKGSIADAEKKKG